MAKFLDKHANIIISILLAALIASTGYYIGFESGVRRDESVTVVSNVSGSQTPADITANFGIFWEAWNQLKTKHIEGSQTAEKKFLEGAIRGLAGSFDDPNTDYFNETDSKKFNDDVRGSFGGIGAEIGTRNDHLVVIAPLKDTPAERAGLKPKDRILAIDSKSTANIKVEEAVKLIRGDLGTRVVLTILRESWTSSKEIEILREVIRIPTVHWKIVDGNLIHLNLYSFNERSEGLFGNAIAEATAKGGRGLILDLRNNPGGYLNVATSLAGWFLERGSTVVIEKFASGIENPLRTYGNEKLKDFPTVILINEGSASASEILSGALRYHRGIELIGTKSFGKGTVQELTELSDKSMLKITIAKWLLPNGEPIDKVGIEPDYKVEASDTDSADKEEKSDPQLDKAIEVLKKSI